MSADATSRPDMRTCLVQAAIAEFGKHGFAAVGTRRIAEMCDTAMSSITYHFGGKEGLYLAAADHIGESISAFIGPAVDAIRIDRCESREAATEALVTLLDRFAQMMLDERSGHWVQFIIREQHHPTQAFDRLFEGAMRPVLDKAVALIRRARPDLDDSRARATAILLWSQAVILRSGRASVARIFDTAEIDGKTADLMRQQIAAQTRCILMLEPEEFP